MSSLTSTRPITLTRELSIWRLSFQGTREHPFKDLYTLVKAVPTSWYEGPPSKTWAAEVCTQSLNELRRIYNLGLLDVAPDELLLPDEQVKPCPPAILSAGTRQRPFSVKVLLDDGLFEKLRALPTSNYNRETKLLTYSAQAAAALSEYVEKGLLVDPQRILQPADITVTFDGRTGSFAILGDPRARSPFKAHYPQKDVVAIWRSKNFDVAFSDELSEQTYRSELIRHMPLDKLPQPPGLKHELHGYQLRSAHMAAVRDGFLIFAQTGLGKTPSAMGAAALVMAKHEAERVVIVCRGTLRDNWEEEAFNFLEDVKPEDVVVIKGKNPEERYARYQLAKTAKYLIIHYEILARDEDWFLPLTVGAYLICDEAHRARNPNAKRSQVVAKARRRAAKCLMLTGTPVDGNPEHAYDIFSLAIPGLLGSSFEFKQRYMWRNVIGKKKDGTALFAFGGSKNLEELRQRVAPHMIRDRWEEAMPHISPIQYKHMQVSVSDPKLANLLKKVHKEAKEEIAKLRRDAAARRRARGILSDLDAEGVEEGAEMTAVGMLKMLCSSPRLLYLSESEAAKTLVESGLIPDEDGPKLDELRIMAAEYQAVGERLIIFSSYKTMVGLIAERFKQDGIKFVTYTGDDKNDARTAAVKAFRDGDSGVTAFIATDAASEGLNLGDHCSVVLNFDLPWVNSTLIQRAARIRRVGGIDDQERQSKRLFTAISMTVAGTMEAGILTLLETKENVESIILGDNPSTSTTGRRTRPRSALDTLAMALDLWDKPAPTLSAVIPPEDRPKKAPKKAKEVEPMPEPPPEGYSNDDIYEY